MLATAPRRFSLEMAASIVPLRHLIFFQTYDGDEERSGLFSTNPPPQAALGSITPNRPT